MEPIIIFTDGACSGNPGPGGWAAIVATPDGRVRELGGAEAHTTNNRMELHGPIEALKAIAELPDAPVELFTDSTYVIGGITSWVHGWKKNGWKKKDGQPVLNREFWEALDRLDSARRKTGPVEWRYVRGHDGNPGNERCDVLSVAFSKGQKPGLYAGPLADYGHDLSIKPPALPARAKSAAKGKSSGGAKSAPVYLSLVGGALERHSSWMACNERVKGVANAKYRKASSPGEEAAILRDWGVGKPSG